MNLPSTLRLLRTFVAGCEPSQPPAPAEPQGSAPNSDVEMEAEVFSPADSQQEPGDPPEADKEERRQRLAGRGRGRRGRLSRQFSSVV